MNKVLLLNGSPRGRGSMSLKLAETFVEGYSSQQKTEVERIDLAEKDIRPCTGCYGCWKSGRGLCVQQDDMADLLPVYTQADLVLVSTPVYHFGMTAILKAFFERSLPLVYPYMVKNGPLYMHPQRVAINPEQAVGLFATCGFPDEDNFRVMKAHFEKLLGERLRFEFLCPEGELLKVPQLREAAAPRLSALKEAGAVFARTDAVPATALAVVASPMVDIAAFARLANSSWSVPGELPPTEAALAGLEPYSPVKNALETGMARAPSAATSPAHPFLEQMRAFFNPKAAAGLEAVLEFEFTDLGEVYQLVISRGECSLETASVSKATTRIVVPFSTWKKISEGELSGEEALMKGAYRVEGDFDLMMRMGSLFGQSPHGDSEAGASKAKRPNLMALAFLPWYFGWFLGGTSFWLGQALPLALSLAFLAYRERRREATWFERGTPIAFAFLSTLALASPGFFAVRWSCICNAAIALVWTLSLIYGRALTSDYSKGDYSQSVSSGPIFRRINFSLTALWSLLFSLEAAAGCCLQSLLPGISQGTIAIASGLLLLPAGIFTAWFPRWYPGHLARRGGDTANNEA
ncbi:MAG: NAD(P)H-dependent oxidoreductase [Rectinemataceae bacterium]|jgi:putative sterol carrier protein/putative NADPH-quinone reductase